MWADIPTLMPITFQIHELGRLKNTRFELHPFLIFTGDSSMGKSYCGFLVYSFFQLLEDREFFKGFVKKLFENQPNKFDITDDSLKKLSIRLNDIVPYFERVILKNFIRLTGNEDINFRISIEVLSDGRTYEDTIGVAMCRVATVNSECVLDIQGVTLNEDIVALCVHWVFSKNFIFNPPSSPYLNVIFPTSRGGIMSSSFTMKRAIANVGMYDDFLTGMDKIMAGNYRLLEISDPVQDETIEQFMAEIFKGKITQKDGEQHYDFQGKSIKLSAAASSIKELSPLFWLLKKVPCERINLLFEEPEAHLHPYLQIKVAELLAYMVNQGAGLQITTHSDYMLSQLNNLLRLYFIRQKSEKLFEQAIAETGIKPEAVLSPEKVGAYYFREREDGSVEMLKSELSEGEQIRFDSFKEAVSQLNENRFTLKEMLEDLSEQEYERQD